VRWSIFPVAFEIQTQKSLALAISPLVGAAVGAMAAALYGLTGALGAVIFWTAVPLFLRESFPGGTLGRVITLLTAVLEWRLLGVAVSIHDPLIICISAQAVPRAAVIALAWISRPAAKPPAYTQALTSWGAFLAIAQGIVAAVLAGWFAGSLILIACYLVTRFSRLWAYKSTGGINQDSLAYARVGVELCVLILLSVPLPGAFPKL